MHSSKGFKEFDAMSGYANVGSMSIISAITSFCNEHTVCTHTNYVQTSEEIYQGQEAEQANAFIFSICLYLQYCSEGSVVLETFLSGMGM